MPLFLIALIFSLTPLDGSDFDIIVILAGVRHESLNMLQIAVTKPVADVSMGQLPPEIEYVMGGIGENDEMLGHKPRYRTLRVGNWMRGVWRRM